MKIQTTSKAVLDIGLDDLIELRKISEQLSDNATGTYTLVGFIDSDSDATFS